MKKFLMSIAVTAALLALRFSFYTVDASEYAYVTLLGRHVGTFDGNDAAEAGLHIGWPWPVQAVQRLDRRVQQFDLQKTELLTQDEDRKTIDRTLTAEIYVCWRIAGAEKVDTFIQRLGTPERARAILGQRIVSLLGAYVGRKVSMNDLISTDQDGQRVEKTMTRIRGYLLDSLKKTALSEYGIELVDVRLRRFYHPAEVRNAIFERIRSERSQLVAKHRSAGLLEASDIESKTDLDVRVKLAEARYKEEKLKAEADREAAAIRNEAFSQDPEFYAFLKKLEKMQSILGDNRTTLLLSSRHPVFDQLFNPPSPKSKKEK